MVTLESVGFQVSIPVVLLPELTDGHNPYILPARPPLLHALPTSILQKQHCVYSKTPMLTVFLLVYLLRRFGASAAPITDAGPPIHDVPIFIRDDSTDADAGRTVWDILWSCLATTFAVTWVSVHPNVPWLEETSWMVLRRRMFLMVLALLAPEVMIMWAFKQWRGAVMIKELVNKARPESCMSYNCEIDKGVWQLNG